MHEDIPRSTSSSLKPQHLNSVGWWGCLGRDALQVELIATRRTDPCPVRSFLAALFPDFHPGILLLLTVINVPLAWHLSMQQGLTVAALCDTVPKASLTITLRSFPTFCSTPLIASARPRLNGSQPLLQCERSLSLCQWSCRSSECSFQTETDLMLASA